MTKLTFMELPKRLAALLEFPINKRDGTRFDLWNECADVLGVAHNTVLNIITRRTRKSRGATLEAIISGINNNLLVKSPVTKEMFADQTALNVLLNALGATTREADEIAIAVEMRDAHRHPLEDFYFNDEARGRRLLESLAGLYTLKRVVKVDGESNRSERLALSVDGLIREGKRYYIRAALEVPGDDEVYYYDGVVCNRMGLTYWVFSQKNEMLADFISMITGPAVVEAKGWMITMYQRQAIPIAASVTLTRLKRSVAATSLLQQISEPKA